MALEYRTGAVPATADTTVSFTIVTPADIVAGDLLILDFSQRGTSASSVADNSGDGSAWTKKGEQLYNLNTNKVEVWWKRATAAMAGGGDTITASGLTNSSTGTLTVYRGAVAAGDPIEAFAGEANDSGSDQTQAAITTVTAGAMVCLMAGFANDVSLTSPACTSPGALVIRQSKLNQGGSDTAMFHCSELKASAGSTGAFTWVQAFVGGSIAYAITPAGAAPASTFVPTITIIG